MCLQLEINKTYRFEIKTVKNWTQLNKKTLMVWEKGIYFKYVRIVNRFPKMKLIFIPLGKKKREIRFGTQKTSRTRN